MPGHFTFYSDKIENNFAYFSEQETKHAILVLRFQLGDSIEFTTGNGIYYTGKIVEIQKKSFLASVDSYKELPQRNFVMAVGILKSSDRMEWLVEKCSEIGVKQLIFLKSQNGERSKINLDKLKKTAVAAMKQSHSAWLMDIQEGNFESALNTNQVNKYIAYCNSDIVQSLPLKFGNDSIVFIGPEGDFTLGEIELAKSYGFQVIGLGSQILRTETAAIVCASWSLS
jgi:16S rRNA (uracil1498-N3)-methyltransferase